MGRCCWFSLHWTTKIFPDKLRSAPNGPEYRRTCLGCWLAPDGAYVFSAVVGAARCAVRAPFEGRDVCVTCTCGVIGSARSDAGGDIAARCPYPLNRYGGASKAMPFIELNDQPVREIFPGFKVHFVHSAHMSFAHWSIEAGARLPEHAHVHEQVVNMIEGEFELTIAGETLRLHPRAVAIIPSNAVHSGRAITDCWIIDAFYPIREDYR